MYEMKNTTFLLFCLLLCTFSCLSYATKLKANPEVDGRAGLSDLQVQRKASKVKAYIKSPLQSIASSEECRDDVLRICGSKKYQANNFDILVCLTNNQDYLWHYKMNVTQGSKFGRMAQDVCRQALTNLPVCNSFDKPDGKIVSCLIENKENITTPTCMNFLTKIQTIIFSDFHLICDFAEECKGDIERHKCGKLDTSVQPGTFQHSQGSVVACLEEKLLKDANALGPQCFTQVIRVAELSAEDYHLDRFLYFQCRRDRETFCADVVAGQGRVYQCLFNHKFDQQMSFKCREALTTRQKVQAIDYKANYPLIHKCKADIKRRLCSTKKVDGDSSELLIHLSSVMLCLEKTDKKLAPLSPSCDEELLEFRRMLMEDYELSPEITHYCANEIAKQCDGGLSKQGKTIHCLMGLAHSQEGLKAECEKAVMDLIEETQPLSDYRLDPVLANACQITISNKCSSENHDDSMVLSCLMDHIHDKDLKKKCKKALIDLQYFISRDFSMDPIFYDACQEEAKNLCEVRTKENGEISIHFSLVLSCLYRNIHPPVGREYKPLSHKCEEEVHRVIKQRALDFHLNPELEKKCRTDLAQLCSEGSLEDNSEFQCLQDQYENLTLDCQKEVSELTELEGRNVLDFDSIMVKECEPMLKQFCQDFVDKSDEGQVVECLIAHKDSMTSTKCAAGITHFQLVEMKDYNFNYKFLKSCQDDIKSYCQDKKSKPKVVECLSEHVRNDVLQGEAPKVSEKCRAQLTVEKLQMHENIKLNPELNKNCKADYKKHCVGVEPGNAAVIECLRKQKNLISHECYRYLYKFEKEESDNPMFDIRLMRRCKSDIREHCYGDYQNGEAQLIVECLLKQKHKLLQGCLDVIEEREKEMFSDIELNVDLHTSCQKDIKKFCKESMEASKKAHLAGQNPNGVVYECLSEIFSQDSDKKLSDSCYRHLEFVIREQEQDYQLNPQLMLDCVSSIEKLCTPKSDTNVVQCLKESFLNNKIKDQPCMMEVAKMLREGRSDIMADPILQEACAIDLQSHCKHIPEGHGRKVTCLINVSGRLLSKECGDALAQRQEMWESVRKQFGGLRDIGISIMESEHSSYILSMLVLLLFLVLLTGTICGRITKRVTRDRKMQ